MCAPTPDFQKIRPLVKRRARPSATAYSSETGLPTLDFPPPIFFQRLLIGDCGVDGVGVVVAPLPKRNQLERRPKTERKVSPDSVAVPFPPTSFSCTTRPPQSPWPLRLVTFTRFSAPIEG